MCESKKQTKTIIPQVILPEKQIYLAAANNCNLGYTTMANHMQIQQRQDRKLFYRREGKVINKKPTEGNCEFKGQWLFFSLAELLPGKSFLPPPSDNKVVSLPARGVKYSSLLGSVVGLCSICMRAPPSDLSFLF